MDRLLNSHLDRMDNIEEQLERIIEQEMAQIDIDEVMANPEAALLAVAQNIKDVFVTHYGHDAVELGLQLGKAIKKKIDQDKTIIIDDKSNSKE